ncbi:hypothetical protein NDU88_006219 [Pleurodeles waltl]|uniref:Uncharacterized protein n=1 Tax=Pleurodeles waltl TaxID=8319 RepID=A0AAV7LZM3_PLEWA|nr:hypothetical protein NDU88_006219 [Pleurodeles waltl]
MRSSQTCRVVDLHRVCRKLYISSNGRMANPERMLEEEQCVLIMVYAELPWMESKFMTSLIQDPEEEDYATCAHFPANVVIGSQVDQEEVPLEL